MQETQEADNKRRSLRSFLETGSEIAGSVLGAAVGLEVEGPGGAMAAAAGAPIASRMLRSGALEFMDRSLSNREKMRVASVVVLAAERIDEKLKLGYEPRHDGFFDGEPGNRSAAEEIAEGVLIAGQREHEEKKLRYLANLLALFMNKDRYSLRREDYRATSTFGIELVAVLQEAADLESRDLLNASGVVVFGLTDVNPAGMDVQGTGIRLYRLMELWRIEEKDLLPLAVLMA